MPCPTCYCQLVTAAATLSPQLRGYLFAHAILLLVLVAVFITGCVSPQGNESLAGLGVALTNASPIVAAASGAAAVTPGAMEFSPLIGAAAALMAALGGWLARHYAQPKIPTPPVPPPPTTPPPQ